MITDECRRESNNKVNRVSRYMDIKKVLKGKELTAKEVAIALYRRKFTKSSDRNNAAPRLTELEQMHLVTVVGSKICQYTGKKVSVYKLVDDIEKWEQLKMELG